MKQAMECPRCIGLGAVVLVVYPEVRSSGCDECAGTGRVPLSVGPGDPPCEAGADCADPTHDHSGGWPDDDGFSDVVAEGLTANLAPCEENER